MWTITDIPQYITSIIESSKVCDLGAVCEPQPQTGVHNACSAEEAIRDTIRRCKMTKDRMAKILGK
jgi:hypothetical protein